MSLHDDILALGRPRTTKADIVEYFKESHGKHWRQPLQKEMARISGLKEKNVARRFDPSRLENVPRTKREQDQYKELGETLPPKPPTGNLHITGTIWVKYSEECVDRTVDMLIVGKDVQRLFKMSEKQMSQAAANAYQADEDEEGNIDFKGPGYCHPPELTVEVV